MASCGMYDFSGEWMLRVGLPAKSGVSGGVMAVAPSQFGVAAFSPRLDAHGNSVRASAIVEILSDRFGMHLLEPHESIAAPGISISQSRRGPAGARSAASSASRAPSACCRCCARSPSPRPRARSSRSMPRELARSHPAAVMVLRTEMDAFAPRFRLLE